MFPVKKSKASQTELRGDWNLELDLSDGDPAQTNKIPNNDTMFIKAPILFSLLLTIIYC